MFISPKNIITEKGLIPERHDLAKETHRIHHDRERSPNSPPSQNLKCDRVLQIGLLQTHAVKVRLQWSREGNRTAAVVRTPRDDRGRDLGAASISQGEQHMSSSHRSSVKGMELLAWNSDLQPPEQRGSKYRLCYAS